MRRSMLLTMVTLLVAGVGSLHAAELLKTNLNRDDVAKTLPVCHSLDCQR